MHVYISNDLRGEIELNDGTLANSNISIYLRSVNAPMKVLFTFDQFAYDKYYEEFFDPLQVIVPNHHFIFVL
jgi:hypothetical protein